MNIKDLCSAELIREERKSLSVRVFPDLRVVVKVPIQASEEEVARFVTKKRSWIKKQLEYFQQFCNCMHLTKLSGSSMLYLGRQYQVIVQKDLQKYIKIEKNKIVVHVPLVDKDIENLIRKELDDVALQ